MRTKISKMIFYSILAAFQIIFSGVFFRFENGAKLTTVLPTNNARVYMCFINKSSII